MFGKFLGGGSKSKPSAQDSKKSSSSNAFGVDPALFEDPKFEEDEVDMPEVDVSGLLKETDAEASVDVTDDDMNDPALLAELNEIADPGSNETLSKIQSLRDQVAQVKKRALDLHKSGDAESARKALTHAKALQAQLDELTGGGGGGGGGGTSAPAPVAATKAAPTPTPTPAPAPVAKPAPAAKPTPQPTRLAPPPKDDDDLLDEDDDSHQGGNKQAEELKTRINTYKRAALASKQAGDRNAALQYMHSAKLLEKALEDAEMGFPVDMKGLPPATPPPPGELGNVESGGGTSPMAKSTGSGASSPVTVMTAAQKEALKRQQTVETLLSELARMVELHKTAALAARDAGDKTGAKAALDLMKEAKSQHDILQAALHDPSIPLPEHHYETKETKHEVAFGNLAPHDLELTILNIKDLRPPAGYQNCNLYVYAEIQFADKDAVQKVTTPVVNNSLSPVFNHTTKLLIDRNKSFQRFVEKRKISFTVSHSRFLLGSVLIGKAEMKLSDLLEKAEIQEDVPIIKDGTRRPVGGTVGVRIRLKTPLVKKDVRVTVEKILVIDGAFPSLAPTSSTTPTKTPTPATATAKSPASTPTPTAKTPAAAAAAPTAKTPATPTTPAAPAQQAPAAAAAQKPAAAPQKPAAAGAAQKPAAAAAQKPAASAGAAAAGGGEEDEMDLDDVNSVDNMISNDVLEAESAAVDAQIAGYAQKKQKAPEELMDRKQAIELKMSILVIQVQSGQITPEKYVEMLKAKVLDERALAKKLVGMGKKEWARYPLQRAKIMESEIESASNADEDE